MTVEIEKIPGGLEVDGVKPLRGKCGCTSLAKCCYSWSKVKQKGSVVTVEAKMSSPDRQDTFNWSYSVSKDDVTVTVTVEDARDKDIYSGFIPPAVEEWESRGWTVEEKTGAREDGVVWGCAMCKWLYKENEEGTPFAEDRTSVV